ncbi:MAG TPA: hypothetical protein PK402_04135 [Tepidisphaeraceae bacterium]|nr:hypothetical protein [Tepidisphaeraceae bacterium]
MGRKAKIPVTIVTPINSKKQLMRGEAVRNFLGGWSEDKFKKVRDDADEHFPKPMIIGGMQLWSVEQIERYVARIEKQADKLSA